MAVDLSSIRLEWGVE